MSSDFSVTKEVSRGGFRVHWQVLRDDISRMAKAVQVPFCLSFMALSQVLANEFSIFEEENEKSQRRKAEQISDAGENAS